MPAAARITDQHTCPMANPNGSPHTGGPILPPGAGTVLIDGQPAACVGDMCACAGPPDTITAGSGTVTIAGRAAARVGDSTAHGGSISAGSGTVVIN